LDPNASNQEMLSVSQDQNALLFTQQMQIDLLLEITQAINSNIRSEELFQLYAQMLQSKMGYQRFAFYIRNFTQYTDFIFNSNFEKTWTCAAYHGVEPSLIKMDILDYLYRFQEPAIMDESQHSLLSKFKYIIPIYHKTFPIAYTLISEMSDDSQKRFHEPVKFISAVSNIIAVAIENKRLFKKHMEQEKMRQEVELAVQVQNMLLPNELPKNETYEFDGVYKPHEGVGGDYYDFIELNSNEIAFCIADISGKGIAAALLMSNFQANLQSLVNRKYLSVPEFAQQLNERVLKTTKGDKFITFFIARYHRYKKILRYINAGHNPPFMISGGKVQFLRRGCTVLGVFPTLPKIEWGEIELKEDSFFFLYTDGLTDLKNDMGDYFDEEKLLEFTMDNQQLPVAQFNAKLLEHLDEFKGDLGFPDDISFLSGKIFVDKFAEK